MMGDAHHNPFEANAETQRAGANGKDTGAESSTFSLQPRNLDEAKELALLMAKSTIIPKQYQGKGPDILVAVAMGAELGLPPIQALQAIAVINGKPSLYGDAVMALCRAHPECEGVHEAFDSDAMTATCTVKRRHEKEQSRTFDQADAERAGLWGKPGPWKQYPQRMLQMRARSWALRDVFADALAGVAVAEEVRDVIDVMPMAATEKDPTPALRDRLATQASNLRQREEE